MKGFLTICCCILMFAACSSSQSKEACLKIYEEGTKKIEKAQTQQEISDISYEVAKQIVEVTKGPDGEVTITAGEEAELRNAQQTFYRAIESRARALNSTAPSTNDKEPVMRTSIK